MSMAVLSRVGLGAGAAVIGAVGSTIGTVVFFGATINNIQDNDWQRGCLTAIMTIGLAMIACSSGYVSVVLAKAVWLKTGVPSFAIAGKAAIVGVLLNLGAVAGAYQLQRANRAKT